MPKCDGCEKCQEVRCCEDSGLVVQKNLLSACFMEGSVDAQQVYNFTIKYEIIMSNKTPNCIREIKIKDSVFGGSSDCLTLTAVNVSTDGNCDGCNLVAQSNASDRLNGILLDGCKSTIGACSLCSLFVTITGYFPNVSRSSVDLLYLQNTIKITGSVKKKSRCGCVCVPIFPVYAVSGIIIAFPKFIYTF
ncbi:MAG: hypothetical protein Dasosvirus1_7 [Dasosvirus sp.]|uniref:Uncharacterized protein n=1 Tax=Dasosvirus sp. TaxID=2487764 RepID=A0A3G4ZR38_9VIRU|nr:MAG: hypothetical protein Dasosvirus1_7 [Dasosvirus sp.]